MFQIKAEVIFDWLMMQLVLKLTFEKLEKVCSENLILEFSRSFPELMLGIGIV